MTAQFCLPYILQPTRVTGHSETVIDIFFMGDFNIDLLQYDTNTISNDFINSITAQFFPYIFQPTRVTDHSATVIDDIFSNITDSESISGNLTTLRSFYPIHVH